MPTWLEIMNNEMRSSFGGPMRRGGAGGQKRYGGGGFGARDYRQSHGRGGGSHPPAFNNRGYNGYPAQPAYPVYAPQAGYGGSYSSGASTDWWDK